MIYRLPIKEAVAVLSNIFHCFGVKNRNLGNISTNPLKHNDRKRPTGHGRLEEVSTPIGHMLGRLERSETVSLEKSKKRSLPQVSPLL